MSKEKNGRNEVVEALAEWICRMLEGEITTPEEYLALPEVVKVYLEETKSPKSIPVRMENIDANWILSVARHDNS